tara:strand:+ start:693 stop:1541 length:849 start_codon:yes stop_codon:yes gene_type:complete
MSNKDLFGAETQILKKPFLRWTGGKNWLVPDLVKIVSKIHFNDYHEPFLGGGSIYFSLETKNKAYLSDYNSDLINAYIQVRDNPSSVLYHLKDFPQTKDFYYELRDTDCKSEVKDAAKFIFLNKTSFNGIYRVNKSGKFNVPYGNRSIDLKLIEELIFSCSTQLQNTDLESLDFKEALNKVKKNDLVFLDPPYTISHNNNGFVKYNEKLFSIVDQFRLSNLIRDIREKGAYYILSNAHHPDVKKIYDKFDDSVLSLNRKSLIAAKSTARNIYKEYIFTNINL